MIEDIAQKIAKSQTSHARTWLIVFAVITLALLPGILFLPGNVESSLEKVMPPFIEELTIINHMRTQFGADMTYVILETEGSLVSADTQEAREYIQTLQSAFQEHDLVVMTQSSVQDPGLLSTDKQLAVIVLATDTGADTARIDELVALVQRDISLFEANNPGFSYTLTGYNVLDKLTFSVIMSDFMIITGVSMSLIALILGLFFKTRKKIFLGMSVLLFAVMWTMGIVGYLNLTITVVSMVAVAMIMGLGIDFSVHVMHTYFHHRHHASKEKSVLLTHQELLRALIGAAGTTIAGFLALLFGVLPAMQVLAIVLSIGIFCTLIGAVALLPVLLYTTEKGDRT